MSDSESDVSPPAATPSEEVLTSALRNAVAKIFQTGKEEELTVKRARLAAEKELKLKQGFFRSDEKWKAKSDQIIRDEAVWNHCAIGKNWHITFFFLMGVSNTGFYMI